MSFELLAPHYTWMEKVIAGPRLQRCRVQWLEELAGCERILIAGVGHGHFLRVCAKRFPHAEIVAVDASAGMLNRAAENADAGGARARFIHASIPEWQPEAGSFDAIVTNFFLDCFAPEELPTVVAALAAGARPRAKWLVSDFAIPARGWQRLRARAIHASMYAFFRPVAGLRARRVTPPDDLLRERGFTLAGRRTTEWGLLQSDFWKRG